MVPAWPCALGIHRRTPERHFHNSATGGPLPKTRAGDGHTLQTTALINEAYLKLVDQSQANWHNRVHFLGVASQLMRRILVDHARRQCRAKRGGAAGHLPLDENLVFSASKPAALVALDDALKDLARDARQQPPFFLLSVYKTPTCRRTGLRHPRRRHQPNHLCQLLRIRIAPLRSVCCRSFYLRALAFRSHSFP